jgi:hypothetical protein
MPHRKSTAEPANEAASKPSAPRGDATASSRPPAPNPTIWADWATMRIIDRPRMYTGPGGSTSGSTAERTPWYTGASSPFANTSPSSAATGIPGINIAPTSTALSRSPVTRAPRAGSRSAAAPSSVPPSR